MNRLAAMEAFVRVVDTGSFSGAARQLGVGQPAVSKAVAHLEERLEVRLLLRSTHGLATTEAGQNFYEHAKRSVEEAGEAELAARGASAALSGRLKICAPVTFARLHVIPRLGEFLTMHPALDVSIVLDDRNIDPVESGGDVALRIGDPTGSALTARKIGQTRRLVLGTDAYFALAGTPRTPTDLSRHQAIIHDVRGGGPTWTFKRDTAEALVMLKGRLCVTAAEGVREAVLHHLGLTVAAEWVFSPEIANGTVRAVLGDWTLPPVSLWAVFPGGRKASAKARAFVNFVETHLSGGRIAGADQGFASA